MSFTLKVGWNHKMRTWKISNEIISEPTLFGFGKLITLMVIEEGIYQDALDNGCKLEISDTEIPDGYKASWEAWDEEGSRYRMNLSDWTFVFTEEMKVLFGRFPNTLYLRVFDEN